MKKLLILTVVMLSIALGATAKKVLDHDVFDSWKIPSNASISNNGHWAAYMVNPQEGDGLLYIYDTRSGKKIMLPRGYRPQFTANSRWAVALIKPLYAVTRKGKIDKKKGYDLPQDTLAIINLQTGRITKYANVPNYKIGEKGGEWIAYTSVDTTHIKAKALKDKKAGKPLVVRDLATDNCKVIKHVKDYVLSKDGMRLAVALKKSDKDSLATDGIGVMLLPDTSFVLIDRDRKFYSAPVFDEAGQQLAFTASNDTIESGTMHADLFLTDLTQSRLEPKLIETMRTARKPINVRPPHAKDADTQQALEEQRREIIRASAGDTLYVNQYSVPEFSHNGRRLIIGLAPEVAPDDTTIVDFERAELDIWRWDAPMTPPQELTNVEKLRKHTYPLVVNIATGNAELMTSNPLVEVAAPDRWDGQWALLSDPTEDIVQQQWDYTAPVNVELVNVDNGTKVSVTKTIKESAELSPAAKYVIYYENRHFYVYDIETGKTVNITESLPYPVWEDSDTPMQQFPYGMAAWTKDDKSVLIYDKYDIWELDPKGVSKPVCLTAGDGRKNNRRYRYVKTDKDARDIAPGETMLLSVFDYGDKRNGLATLKAGKAATPALKTLDTYQYNQLRKAKDADVYTFTKANFSTCPDIYLSNGSDFAKARKLTDVDSQRAEYWWGTAELVKWYAFDGREVEGILYKPEDFDPTKKYPMIAYFYEQNSETLYRHYTLEPSWSWINFPFYTSRGYVIFVPDVHYTSGIPGEGAYNCIVSGVEDLCKRYDWIDKDRIGIDGQSWGGYQTAYLITRTDMFRCAGSGAPVANMTSAFGGIRWGTGDSRQAQYEQGQSRIGRNLWEAPELYIANSPLFHLDRVKTPLLIMHNDADGAVPWYQGIELFMGLRRLHKPVWMLQYNGESHNIKDRKNRKDITIRLQQFFDHYLQGAPMPKWMKDGIPATRKGQQMGTELVTEE